VGEEGTGAAAPEPMDGRASARREKRRRGGEGVDDSRDEEKSFCVGTPAISVREVVGDTTSCPTGKGGERGCDDGSPSGLPEMCMFDTRAVR
jgi:hypothetical protein